MKQLLLAMAMGMACACVPPPADVEHKLAVPEEDRAEDARTGGTRDGGGSMRDAGAPDVTSSDAGGADAGSAAGRDAGRADAGEDAPDAEQSLPDAGMVLVPADAGSGALLPFGAACTTDTECVTVVCRPFGQLGQVCTKTCVGDPDCPVGSMGQKCNQQGLCRP